MTDKQTIEKCRKEIRSFNLCLIIIGITCIIIAFIAPNGSNPRAQELWYNVLIKGSFVGLGIMALWSSWKQAALPTRIFCRIFFGKKSYQSWLRVAKLYDAKKYKEI